MKSSAFGFSARARHGSGAISRLTMMPQIDQGLLKKDQGGGRSTSYSLDEG